jgi:hypothetical protein
VAAVRCRGERAQPSDGPTRIGKVADAYAAIAAIAAELSDAIERDDRKSGLIRDDHRRTA